jgi:hypothetical protein
VDSEVQDAVRTGRGKDFCAQLDDLFHQDVGKSLSLLGLHPYPCTPSAAAEAILSSFEVERAINSHPSVLESAAVAVGSELAEDEVKICVVLKPGEKVAPEELIAYAAERMPYFAVPRFVEFMESLPKTPTERVQKYLLKQAGITPNTWDREKAGIEINR